MPRFTSRVFNPKRKLLSLLLIFVAFSFTFLFFFKYLEISKRSLAQDKIREVRNTNDLGKQKEIIKDLLITYGPIKTQELMEEGLPNTGQSHLLVHEVGDYIYDKYGDKALTYCKDYFLYACYHGVIIREVADRGIAGVQGLLASCKNSGRDQYYQCAHATGHGLLAWHDYDLPKALEACNEIGSQDSFISEPCYRGVFMENIFGLHRGAPIPIEQNRWLSVQDFYYPCNSVEKKYSSACWYNQGGRIYDMVNGDLERVGQLCGGAATADHINECYNGLFRRINTISGGNGQKIVDFCSEIGKDWFDVCIKTNMSVSVELGDRKGYIMSICDLLKEVDNKNSCWEYLISLSDSLHIPFFDRVNFCRRVTNNSYQEKCYRNLVKV